VTSLDLEFRLTFGARTWSIGSVERPCVPRPRPVDGPAATAEIQVRATCSLINVFALVLFFKRADITWENTNYVILVQIKPEERLAWSMQMQLTHPSHRLAPPQHVISAATNPKVFMPLVLIRTKERDAGFCADGASCISARASRLPTHSPSLSPSCSFPLRHVTFPFMLILLYDISTYSLPVILSSFSYSCNSPNFISLSP